MGRILSVHQINKYIKNMFLGDFLLGDVQVQGEVSNCKYHQSGHVYFTLKDEKAAVNCAMFAGNRVGLTFSMKDGDKVVVSGYIDIYEKNGTYQLYARKIKLQGAGELYKKFLELKNELLEMGMFAPEYKKDIPRHPKRVGIVTAPTGAAIRDIQNILKRRNPGISIILYPAIVQGDGAKQSIVNGIRTLDDYGVDVMIVGRGGGSIEDLWAFNEEIVARAIFDCNTPVISAVGHETDVTIADFVADLRAPTPSAAAELATEDIAAVIDRLNTTEKRLEFAMGRGLDAARAKLQSIKNQLYVYKPDNVIAVKREKLSKAESLLRAFADCMLNENKHRLALLAGRLDAASPLKKLSEGFGYIQGKNDMVISSVSQVKNEDVIKISLKDGDIKARVLEVEKQN